VLSERPISRSEVLLQARVVGGIPTVDRGEADDKIVSILHGDPVYGAIREIAEVPEALINRLIHYFSTYKLGPDEEHQVKVGRPYGREHAETVISAALADYREEFGGPSD
jgi:inorganic pyrophosphatase